MAGNVSSMDIVGCLIMVLMAIFEGATNAIGAGWASTNVHGIVAVPAFL